MTARTSAELNFFASLMNPGEVLARCERSTALNALTSQKHSADRPGRRQCNELAAWDAAVDQGKSDAEWRRRNLVGAEDLVTGGVKLVEVSFA